MSYNSHVKPDREPLIHDPWLACGRGGGSGWFWGLVGFRSLEMFITALAKFTWNLKNQENHLPNLRFWVPC